MTQEQIIRISRFPPHLTIKIQSTLSQTTLLKYNFHNRCSFHHIHGKLISIPPQQRITRVTINTPQFAIYTRHINIVLKLVPRQSRMIWLNIQFKLLLKTILRQKSQSRLSIVIILMFRRLAWFWLNQKLRRVPLAFSIVNDHAVHGCHVIALFFQIGVEQGLIPLTPTPKHVVFTSQFRIHVHDFFDLAGGVAVHRQIGVRHPPVHVPFVRKQILRRPQQLDARLALFLEEVVGNRIQIRLRFRDRGAFRCHVKIVKGVVVDLQFRKQFERHVDPTFREGDGIGYSVFPRSVERFFAKGILSPASHERVPEADTEAEPVFHRFPHYYFIFVVVLEGKGVF
mmetsp:Transcript_38154/g.46544  ORF Transcript_38154/g.46544 Transcript_38154/m.46544 type:complete len:341 (-) Transcript_38154:137-1159(-)